MLTNDNNHVNPVGDIGEETLLRNVIVQGWRQPNHT